jgi:hypothetical protein
VLISEISGAENREDTSRSFMSGSPGDRMPSNRSLSPAVFAALLASALVVPAARAQEPLQAVPSQPRWTLTGWLEVLHAGADSWGFGPALGIRRDFGPSWGVELRAALPAFNGSGGGAIDLAATYRRITRATELGASVGGTGFLVGDQSELTGGGVGLYLAAHATGWLSRGVGLTAGANLRTAVGTFPGAFAGVALRF